MCVCVCVCVGDTTTVTMVLHISGKYLIRFLIDMNDIMMIRVIFMNTCQDLASAKRSKPQSLSKCKKIR